MNATGLIMDDDHALAFPPIEQHVSQIDAVYGPDDIEEADAVISAAIITVQTKFVEKRQLRFPGSLAFDIDKMDTFWTNLKETRQTLPRPAGDPSQTRKLIRDLKSDVIDMIRDYGQRDLQLGRLNQADYTHALRLCNEAIAKLNKLRDVSQVDMGRSCGAAYAARYALAYCVCSQLLDDVISHYRNSPLSSWTYVGKPIIHAV